MTAARREHFAGFAAGQRGPDFMLPNSDGRLGRFYDRFTGNRVVLFFSPAGHDARAARELRDFAARSAAFEAESTRIVAVTPASIDTIADLRDRHDIDFTLFADPAGAITEGYGAAPAAPAADGPRTKAGGCTTYVLDRNQRVVAACQGGTAHADWALDRLRRAAPEPAKTRLVTAQAPVLLLPNVAAPDLCAEAIAAWRADHAEGEVRLRGAKSGAGSRGQASVNHDLKRRLDHRPGEALNRALTEAVISRIAPELMKAFQFQVVAAERFCIAAYEASRGDYFRPHRDNTTEATEKRRFAVTVNLNDGYDGGGLRFPEFGDDIYATGAGGAVVFSCTLMHEALPVTRGTRFAGLSFMFGPGDLPGG